MNIKGLLCLLCTLCFIHGTHASKHKTTTPPSLEPTKTLIVLTVQGGIGPASADYIERGIKKANQLLSPLILLKLDTPGGLSTAMRTIIKAILASDVPVVAFVNPSGARAASAGTFILYASHIAAMSPGTNIGAASPVSITGGLPTPNANKSNKKNTDPNQQAAKEKATQDALAYIRSLAQLRGRNSTFAEKAVSKAETLTAKEALQQQVIDYIANDTSDLLTQLHGKKVQVKDKIITLNTKNIRIKHVDPDWRSKFLSVITDPSIAYVLLLMGVYGLFFEFYNPGFVIPGVVGAIAILLALYALQLLPISYAGLALILLGIIFMVAEAFVPSFGALGIGGIIAFIVGSILLFDTALPGYQIAWPLIFSMAIANAVFFFFVISIAIRARKRHIVSGKEELIDMVGEVLDDFHHTGQIKVHGEIWQAQTTVPLTKGQHVKVTAITGLKLIVKPTNNRS